MPFNLHDIDKNWTLFLDRDGVINVEIPGMYVLNPSQFRFHDRAPQDLAWLTQRFGLLLIATNQRGVTRGLMSEQDLLDIHAHMLAAVEAEGGRIEKIYYSLGMEMTDPMRKPNPGMARAASRDFPHIDFSRSVMIGNTVSDMEFGRNAGMHTVYVRTTAPDLPMPHAAVDYVFDDLHDFTEALKKS